MKKYIGFILMTGFIGLAGCEMDEPAITATDKKAIFSSEEGLKAYSMSFYNIFPDATSQSIVEQSLVDYGATNTLSGFTLINSFSENNSSGWSWSDRKSTRLNSSHVKIS